jgi:two-component system, response regulator
MSGREMIVQAAGRRRNRGRGCADPHRRLYWCGVEGNQVSRSRSILLVEDNEDDVELTLRAFARSEVLHEITVVRDGAAAVDYLLHRDARADAPEVVLLDLKLPRLDGLEVLRRLRADERTRRLPVVVLTSSDEEQDLAACYDLGANSFVRKPVDFARFVHAANQLGSYWLELNEPAPLPR